MMRRNISLAAGTADPLGNPPRPSGQPSLKPSSRARRGGSDDAGGPCSALAGLPLWALVLLAAGITVATYSFQSVATVQEMEQEVWHELSKLYQQHQPPVMVDGIDHSASSPSAAKASDAAADAAYANGVQLNEASKRMLQQDSRWVDGEKKLKIKLKELVRLQSEGKLLGTPALTRFLGDDFPAWVAEGADKDEWEKKVTAKYVEMRQAEAEWNAKMEAIIERERRRG